MQNVFQNTNLKLFFFMAAYKHVPLMEENPSQAILTNIRDYLGWFIQYKVKICDGIYRQGGKPSNVFGASKRIAEKYVQSLQFKIKHKKKTTLNLLRPVLETF
jgi:FlaA1/EpsC-like NDP-sugar epimerase